MEKRQPLKKLTLNRETLRALTEGELFRAAGGSGVTWSAGTSWFGCGGTQPTCNG
jgi:hypothetical protein